MSVEGNKKEPSFGPRWLSQTKIERVSEGNFDRTTDEWMRMFGLAIHPAALARLQISS